MVWITRAIGWAVPFSGSLGMVHLAVMPRDCSCVQLVGRARSTYRSAQSPWVVCPALERQIDRHIHRLRVCMCRGAACLGRRGRGLAGFRWEELAAVVNHPLLPAMISRRIGPLRLGVAAGWAIRFGCDELVVPPGTWMAQP